MKLLSKNDIKTTVMRREDETAKILASLQRAVDQKTKEVNKVTNEYAAKKEFLESEFELLFKDLRIRKETLTAQVSELSAQKCALEKCLSEGVLRSRQDEITQKESDLNTLSMDYKQRVGELEAEKADLRNKLKEYEYLKGSLEGGWKDLEKQREGVAQKREQLVEETKAFQIKVQTFESEKDAALSRINERIMLLDQELDGAKKLRQANEEEKERIDKDRAHLQSQQHSLAQAFYEARQKNLL